MWGIDVETGTSSAPFIVGGRGVTGVAASAAAGPWDAGGSVVAAAAGDMVSVRARPRWWFPLFPPRAAAASHTEPSRGLAARRTRS